MNIFAHALIIACIFSGCARTPKHIKAIRKTGKILNTELRKNYGLLPIRFGGDFHEKIHEVHLDYELFESVDLARAKSYVGLCVDGMRKEMDCDTELRPYLQQYPVPANKISVSIAFLDAETKRFQEGTSIAQVECNEGVLSYFRFDKNLKRLTLIKEEPLLAAPQTS